MPPHADHIRHIRAASNLPGEVAKIVTHVGRTLGLELQHANTSEAATLWVSTTEPYPHRLAAHLGSMQRHLGPHDKLVFLTHVNAPNDTQFEPLFDLTTTQRRLLLYSETESLAPVLQGLFFSLIWHPDIDGREELTLPFVGRGSELRHMREAIDTSSLLIEGRKRIGKTRLLAYFADMLEGHGIEHHTVELSALSEEAVFARHLNRALGDPLRLATHLKIWNIAPTAHASLGQRGGLTATDSSGEPWHSLGSRSLDERLNDRREPLVIILDDLDRFVARLDRARRKALCQWLVEMASEHRALRWVVSGAERFNLGRSLPDFAHIHLTHMSVAEADRLISVYCTEQHMSATTDARATLRDLFGHAPDALLQAMGLLHAQLPGARRYTEDLMHAFFETVLGNPKSLHLPDWWSLESIHSESGVHLLEHVLAFCAAQSERVALEQIWFSLRESMPEGIPLDELRDILDNLVYEGYFTVRKGSYAFASQLYREHFLRSAMAREVFKRASPS